MNAPSPRSTYVLVRDHAQTTPLRAPCCPRSCARHRLADRLRHPRTPGHVPLVHGSQRIFGFRANAGHHRRPCETCPRTCVRFSFTPKANSNTGSSGEPGKVAQLLQLRSRRSRRRRRRRRRSTHVLDGDTCFFLVDSHAMCNARVSPARSPSCSALGHHVDICNVGGACGDGADGDGRHMFWTMTHVLVDSDSSSRTSH